MWGKTANPNDPAAPDQGGPGDQLAGLDSPADPPHLPLTLPSPMVKAAATPATGTVSMGSQMAASNQSQSLKPHQSRNLRRLKQRKLSANVRQASISTNTSSKAVIAAHLLRALLPVRRAVMKNHLAKRKRKLQKLNVCTRNSSRR